MGLAQFERRLERLVEGAFAKAFRSGVQPVEIARRITREMDLRRQVAPNGLIAPNLFEVRLSTAEAGKFSAFTSALEQELAEAVREHAREEDYQFVGTVVVSLVEDPALRSPRFQVSSEVRANPGGLPGAALILPDGRRVAVLHEPVTIGRLPECAVSLVDPNVSRRHAEVRRAGNDVIVVDLGSTNGTRVNGSMTSRHRLSHGDEITVGGTTLFFEAV